LKIIDLDCSDNNMISRVAQLLIDVFIGLDPEAWPDMPAALEEVRESLAEDAISRVAVDEDGSVQGWIAGRPSYSGNVWELHPLAVRPDRQRQGIGGLLVRDFERLVREHGGLTITLGTDDTTGRTTLFGVDLYPNVWEHLMAIRNLGAHPYEFYQKKGYVITGVIPDANGPGKPDILMSKRVG
jgi:aminoglycoside 6'-N-acetyltransferase I